MENSKRRKGWPQRKKLRLEGYDYRLPGAYVITICTEDRQWLFQNPILQAILYEEWTKLSQRYEGVAPGTIMVMYDHLHCILVIEGEGPGIASVSQIIGAYKSCAANAWLRYIKENNVDLPGKIWQAQFHDHIVRGKRDFDAQNKYILNNPAAFEEKQRAKQEEREKKKMEGKDVKDFSD
ncbi:hypothetical protein KDA_65220 [Dictyobacter alpinus]|uniref:Transposase IS200-like domain-containing protein n=1 Tax=Dictyobacter alpinus TaxID=2014873 RepID=A0A402BI05_9CHLR|nr:transposase [Dictyobacter alpinus]GCE31038.1 hypothetical protein KDA_65220 [Dictyobacter alpinus]